MPEGTKQFLDLEGLRLYDTKIKELIAEHSGSGETVDWDNVANKPEFATVATTGSYDDLTDKPVIPVVPALATVATTGSYEDLVDTPTIPVVPTNVSDFTNDAGYITLNDIPASTVTDIEVSTDGSSYTSVIDENNVAKIDLSDYAATADLATVATTGSYDDLTDKPVIPSSTSDLTNDSGFITLTDIPEGPTLATVATSGDYTDLSNKPVIPSNTSDLTNDSGFITLADVPEGPVLATVATTGSYDDLTDKPVIPTVTTASAIADEDTGYTTGDQVYDYVEAHKADAVTITTVKVNGSTLTPDANKAVDITVPSAPVQDVRVSTDGSAYTSVMSGTNADIDLSGYATISSLATVATSGSYDDLEDKPFGDNTQTALAMGDFSQTSDSSYGTQTQIYDYDMETHERLWNDIIWAAISWNKPSGWQDYGDEYVAEIWGEPAGHQFRYVTDLDGMDPAELLNHSVKLTYNGSAYDLPIQLDHENGEEVTYSAGQKTIGNGGSYTLWTHPFQIAFNAQDGEITEILVSLRLTEDVTISDVALVIGEIIQIDPKYIPTAVEIAASDTGFTTGEQVYQHYINTRVCWDDSNTRDLNLKKTMYVVAEFLDGPTAGTYFALEKGDVIDVTYNGTLYEGLEVQELTFPDPDYPESDLTYLYLGNMKSLLTKDDSMLHVPTSIRDTIEDNGLPFCYTESSAYLYYHWFDVPDFETESQILNLALVSDSSKWYTLTFTDSSPGTPMMVQVLPGDFQYNVDEFNPQEDETIEISFNGVTKQGTWDYYSDGDGYDEWTATFTENANDYAELKLISSNPGISGAFVKILDDSIIDPVSVFIQIGDGELHQLDPKYIPTASSIADSATGYATGDQVYDYVQANKGDTNIIEVVKFKGNGDASASALTIDSSNKSVTVDVSSYALASQIPTVAAAIADGDTGYATGAQVYNAIAGFAGAMHFKGVIAGAASLPNAPEVGDVYIASAAFNFGQEAVEAGDLFVYTNNGWKIIQGNLDVAAIPGLLNQITTNDIDGLFE